MKRYIYLLLFGFLLTQSVVYAETIRGMITNLDPATNTLLIRRTDTSSTTSQDINVKVKTDTKTTNVASLKELQVGHEVKIDAKEDKASGVFEAKSIEVTGSQSTQASSASQPASSDQGSAQSSQSASQNRY